MNGQRRRQSKNDEILAEQEAIQGQITRLKDTEAKYFEKYIDIIDLARRVGEIYQNRCPEEKRMLLKSIFSNLVIKDKKVAYTLNKPMEIILRRVQEKIDSEKLFEPEKTVVQKGQKGVSTPLHPSLLRLLDSNQGPTR